MEESLKRIINKLILPKYPWIKDFNVKVTKDGVQDLYSVYYYVDDDLYDRKSKQIRDVISKTNNLYSALGPSEYDWFSGVSFRTYNG